MAKQKHLLDRAEGPGNRQIGVRASIITLALGGLAVMANAVTALGGLVGLGLLILANVLAGLYGARQTPHEETRSRLRRRARVFAGLSIN